MNADNEPSLEPSDILQHSCLSNDLRAAIKAWKEVGGSGEDRFRVMIEMNNSFPGGARRARASLVAAYVNSRGEDAREDMAFVPELLALAKVERPCTKIEFQLDDQLNLVNSSFTEGYLFGILSLKTLTMIASSCHSDPNGPVYKIWLDQPFRGAVYKSFKTIKCDAARIAFGAQGEGIVWAVADTGVDETHPHFATHGTLRLPAGLGHFDFTDETHKSENAAEKAALVDTDGHGSHVAGIIAGETNRAGKEDGELVIDDIVISIESRPDGLTYEAEKLDKPPCLIQGVAPLTKIMSLKVLTGARDEKGISYVISAIGYIQRLNEYGRNLRVHGLNLSLGYKVDPKWFATGQSPVCKEVNRLVRSGVVVVVAAGNAGFGYVSDQSSKAHSSANASTIADPGNAELAITVGSTHRDRPHEYGVSFFSAKGPTIDGRMKPDILAPGERIVSCDPGPNARIACFKERSGTSMAASHVSGLVAALLSVRREFIGQPDRVKAILMSSATDLGRLKSFQGSGVADLMRALQSI